MTAYDVFSWVQSTRIALLVREGYWGYLLPQIVHLASMALFGGAVVMQDIRILGGIRGPSFQVLLEQLASLQWAGFWLTTISGMLLFAGDATRFYHNPSFVVKVILLLLIALNTWVFRSFISGSAAVWGVANTVPTSAKASAAISLLLWIGVLVASRGIAFTLTDV